MILLEFTKMCSVAAKTTQGKKCYDLFLAPLLQTLKKSARKAYTFDAEEFSLAYKALTDGNPKLWLDLADRRLAQTSGVHMAVHVNEAAFQMMLSSTLWASGEYGGQLEIESRGENSGFIDLLLTPKHDTSLPSYVIEVKHLKTDATDEAVQKALAEAKTQAERYAQGEAVKRISNLKRLALVYKGLRLSAFEIF